MSGIVVSGLTVRKRTHVTHKVQCADTHTRRSEEGEREKERQREREDKGIFLEACLRD